MKMIYGDLTITATRAAYERMLDAALGFSAAAREEMLPSIETSLRMWSRQAQQGELTETQQQAARGDLMIWHVIKELAGELPQQR